MNNYYFTPSYMDYRPPWKAIAKGILPSLCHVVHQRSKIGFKEKCGLLQNKKFPAKDYVPERNLNPLTRPVDPFGNDYTCKICDRELTNTYFHCEGCEELLLKDYNICDECFTADRFKCNTNMNDEKLFDWATNIHHIGEVSKKRCESCR